MLLFSVLWKGANGRHATVGVVVERCKSIVDVFWSSEETKSTECPQQFIIDSAIKKKVSLKTLAKVLSKDLRGMS
jgi:hypothetical protein